MDGMNVWRIIYNNIEAKNPNKTGSEILAMAKEAFNEIMEEVSTEIRKEVK